MYNIESNYPSTVDDLIFYQDADINKQKLIQQYNQLITNEQYDEAYAFRDENGLHCLNAELINMLINRTKKLQEKILTLQKEKNIYFDTDKPTNPTAGIIWISNRNGV